MDQDEELQKMDGLGEKRSSSFTATKIWNQLLNSFKEGMQLKRKRWRLKSYDQCFSGAEALVWMHSYLQNSQLFDAYVTREQAFLLLQKFLENNVFECVQEKSRKMFQDTNCLYRFAVNAAEKEKEEENKENMINSSNIHHLTLPNMFKSFKQRNSLVKEGDDSVETNMCDINNGGRSFGNVSDAYNLSSYLCEDEVEPFDAFSSSISQNNFMRSNSVRYNKRGEEKSFSAREFSGRKPLKRTGVSLKLTKYLRNTKSLPVSVNPVLCDEHLKSSPSKRFKSDSHLLHLNTENKKFPAKALSILGENADSLKDDKFVCFPGYRPSLEKSERKVLPKQIDRKSLSTFDLSKNSVTYENSPHNQMSATPESKAHGNGDCQSYPIYRRRRSVSQSRLSQLGQRFQSMNDVHNGCLQEISHSKTIQDLKQCQVKLTLRQQKGGSLSSSNLLGKKRKSQSLQQLSDSPNKYNLTKPRKQLCKISSTWTVNEIGLSPAKDQSNQVEDAWVTVIISRLKKLLKVERVSDYLNEGLLSGEHVVCNAKNHHDLKVLPAWLDSAMECLTNWPKSRRNFNGLPAEDLPEFSGFPCDVFKAVKEHYHTTLMEPLMPCHFFGILQECVNISHSDLERATKVLQLILLLLPSWNRNQLNVLVKFMKKIATNKFLSISQDLLNKELVIHSFYRLIVRRERRAVTYTNNDVVSIRICTLLMERFESVFQVPTDIWGQVDHLVAVTMAAKPLVNQHEKSVGAHPSSARSMKRSRSYCVQITTEQYRQEADILSKNAIRDLLLTVLNDKRLTGKQKNKRLQKFQVAYPELYAEYSSCHASSSNEMSRRENFV